MDREEIRGAAHVALAAAPLVFAMRAFTIVLDAAPPPGWTLAAVGILSGLGMAALVVLNWKSADHWRTIAAVAVALLGHYVVAEFWSVNLGGAMVYLGTGFLVSLRLRWAQFAGMVAGIGALLRGTEGGFSGHYFLIVGAVALSAAAILAADLPGAMQRYKDRRAEKSPSEASK